MADIIIISVLAIVAFFIARSRIRSIYRGGCHKGCAGCSGCAWDSEEKHSK